MSQNQSDPNAGGHNPDGNLSANELIAGLSQATEDAPSQEEEIQSEESDEIEQEESEQIEEESQEEDESESEEGSEDDIIEQLLSGDPEELKRIARMAGSRGLSRIAELTAKVKGLEAKLAATPAETKPLPKPIADNPYADLKTVEEVQSKREDMEKVVEDMENILDQYEHYGPEDVIKVGKAEYTKADLKIVRRNAQQALLKFLPAQEAQIQRSEQIEKEMGQWDALMIEHIPELADENSELAKQFELAKNRPEYKEMMATSERPRVNFILAHALRSIHQLSNKKQKSAVVAPGTKLRPKLPTSPVGATSKPISGKGAQSEFRQKFEHSGSQQDLVAMLSKS